MISTVIREISVLELKEMFDSSADFELIDVREKWEKNIADIGGKLIPVNEVHLKYHEIPKDKMTIIYCRSGKRSANAVKFLMENYGYQNLLNLKGGILAWSDYINKSLPKY
ncbi:MAG: hypothetical protein MI922_09815 [Bacteroidales bacterium]|nr:hypothetical protein [Bacteroidales bacterium]